jgi:tetratricopeptide (TPR) repeat protein
LSHVEEPLTELRVVSDGKDVIVERDGSRLEPLSGQFVLNFETRELEERVSVMSARTADEWFAKALECETNSRTSGEAISAYDQALSIDPKKVEALINCGTLYYEQGDLEKASEYFGRAVDCDAQNALAHSNLGSVLEELGQMEDARQHLRLAVRLDPTHSSDARYNLALVCEKLGAHSEARKHWQDYIRIDPTGPWSDYARQRLASSPAAKSARR